MPKLLFIIISWTINVLFSLILFLAAFVILFLYFQTKTRSLIPAISELEPILFAGIYAILAAPIGLIPAFWLSRKTGKLLMEKRKWKLDPINRWIYIAIGIYFVPLLAILTLQLI